MQKKWKGENGSLEIIICYFRTNTSVSKWSFWEIRTCKKDEQLWWCSERCRGCAKHPHSCGGGLFGICKFLLWKIFVLDSRKCFSAAPRTYAAPVLSEEIQDRSNRKSKIPEVFLLLFLCDFFLRDLRSLFLAVLGFQSSRTRLSERVLWDVYWSKHWRTVLTFSSVYTYFQGQSVEPKNTNNFAGGGVPNHPNNAGNGEGFQRRYSESSNGPSTPKELRRAMRWAITWKCDLCFLSDLGNAPHSSPSLA